MDQDPARFVADLLKRQDADRYYATLLLPEPARAPVQALYAFSLEIAGISERVRDANAGEIRLQWWRDALEGHGHGDVDRNPVASALANAVGRFRLAAKPLLDLLEARSFDLYADPMPDVPAFEGYAGATVSVPYQLSAMMLNEGRPVEPGDAAGHLGVAHALIGHLRALGYNAARNRIYLPLSVLEANGVQPPEIFAGTVSEGLLAGLGQLQEMAATHLDAAAAAIDALPRALRPVFAMIAVLRGDLESLRRNSEHPFVAPPRPADWRRIAALWWWNWRHTRGGTQ